MHTLSTRLEEQKQSIFVNYGLITTTQGRYQLPTYLIQLPFLCPSNPSSTRVLLLPCGYYCLLFLSCPTPTPHHIFPECLLVPRPRVPAAPRSRPIRRRTGRLPNSHLPSPACSRRLLAIAGPAPPLHLLAPSLS